MLQNETLTRLVEVLTSDQARKHDMVVPAPLLRSKDSALVVAGAEPVLSADGVTTIDGIYYPTTDCVNSIANRLEIPTGYLRRMVDSHPDLYDQNVNGWLQHSSFTDKRFLVRTFNDGEQTGIARALLSDVYRPIDHLDTLFTVLDAIRSLGLNITPAGCDLTDRRFYVRLDAPEVKVYSEKLLRNYRDPRTGQTGADNPGIQAGLLVTNSETGHGQFSIAPFVKILVCSNGMTATKHALSRQHLGAKLPDGIFKPSQEVDDAALGLIKAQVRQAVTTFLDVEWMRKLVAELEQDGQTPVKEPETVVKTVTSRLRYTDAQREEIMRQFILGADPTAFGVVQAITSAAQDQDPDTRADMEADSFRALEFAVAASR